MNYFVKTGGKLTLICAVAALSLGFINEFTEPRIERIRLERLERALGIASLGDPTGEKVEVGDVSGVRAYYPVLTEERSVKGYVLELVGAGYGGDMILLAGYTSDGKIMKSILMDNQETPGLGKEAERDDYMEMFRGKGGESGVPVRRDQLPGEYADAISGATITFMGVGSALDKGSAFAASLSEQP